MITYTYSNPPESMTCGICQKTKSSSEFKNQNKYRPTTYFKHCHPCRAQRLRIQSRAREKRKVVDWQSELKQAMKNPMFYPILKRRAGLYFDNQERKQQARQILLTAFRAGEVKRQSCQKCGKKKAQAHHSDYSKPMLVDWLCGTCHGIAHVGDLKMNASRLLQEAKDELAYKTGNPEWMI